MSDTPRWYKWYPEVSCDLGSMPFEGSWTTKDRIYRTNPQGMQVIYFSNTDGTEFGRRVTKKVGNRTMQVWEPGVFVEPVSADIGGETAWFPVWFEYYGDGVCAVKLPGGEVEEVAPGE